MDNSNFNKLGFQVVRAFIDPANYLKYLKLLLGKGDDKPDPFVSKGFQFPRAFLFEKLLVSMCPVIQAYCGYEIRPTYSFARIYKYGSKLKKHLDR